MANHDRRISRILICNKKVICYVNKSVLTVSRLLICFRANCLFKDFRDTRTLSHYLSLTINGPDYTCKADAREPRPSHHPPKHLPAKNSAKSQQIFSFRSIFNEPIVSLLISGTISIDKCALFIN